METTTNTAASTVTTMTNISWLTCFLLITSGPFLAVLYQLCVCLTYAINHELPWSCLVAKPMTLRMSFWVASIAIAMGMAMGKTNKNNDDDWWWQYNLIPSCLVGLTLWICSVYALQSTRRATVVGIPDDAVPFYGSDAMKDKIVVITGANNGIGKETAYQLACMGATVVMLCRSTKRAEAAVQELCQRKCQCCSDTCLRKEQFIVIEMDLGHFESIRNAVEVLKQRLLQLQVHVLINNAGLMMGHPAKSQDGYELMMQANHLGHFLLTQLLIQEDMMSMKNDKEARVINLTSCTYSMASKTGFDFDDMFCDKGSRKYTLFGQYSMTKLANLLHVKELVRRNSNGNLLVYAVHPGIVRTSVTKNMQWFLRIPNDIFGFLVATMQKTPTEGAYSTVYVAAAATPEPPIKNGSYIVNCKPHPVLPCADSDADAKRLWDVSEELVGLCNVNKKYEHNDNKDDAEEKKE